MLRAALCNAHDGIEQSILAHALCHVQHSTSDFRLATGEGPGLVKDDSLNLQEEEGEEHRESCDHTRAL